MTATIERRRAGQYGPSTRQTPQIAKAGEAGYAFTGYAVRWGAVSEDLGGFKEKIARGAFTKTISGGKNIVAILDHEKKVQNVLGSTANIDGSRQSTGARRERLNRVSAGGPHGLGKGIAPSPRTFCGWVSGKPAAHSSYSNSPRIDLADDQEGHRVWLQPAIQ